MKNLTELPAWHALVKEQPTIKTQLMRDWFAANPERFSQFSIEHGDLLLDYSRNLITTHTRNLLIELAHAVDLKRKIHDLFNGAIVNPSEHRPALHTALRNPNPSHLSVKGQNIAPAILDTKQAMFELAASIHQGRRKGATGKPITHIVNIGIGGSYLGPLLATQALKEYANPALQCHFIANVDKDHVYDVLETIDPAATLFIVSSKSFTTIETLTNARTIMNWMQKAVGKNSIEHHFIAVTAAADKAKAFGIPAQHIFPLWDWVGGRYSVWSAIGLPLLLMIGKENYQAFLDGAYQMDQHFQQADFSQNIPVILALLGIWYTNFFGSTAQAIVPYAYRLRTLIPYLQQADMESNGKSVDQHGNSIQYTTSPVIFGEEGCNGQHTFHQLLHQGQHFIPVDFIMTGKDNLDSHENILLGSAISQADALMRGKTKEEAAVSSQISPDSTLAAHQRIPGNRPSNLLYLRRLTPTSLGSLLALYEHKIYVQGAIWNINSFDQWGVELGKQLLPDIIKKMEADINLAPHNIIRHIKKASSSHEN